MSESFFECDKSEPREVEAEENRDNVRRGVEKLTSVISLLARLLQFSIF
jgi:hypothetical protein